MRLPDQPLPLDSCRAARGSQRGNRTGERLHGGVSRKGPDSRGQQARKALLEGGRHEAVS